MTIDHMTSVLPCILFDNVFNGSSSFGSVSLDSSSQSCISITINKKFHIAKFTNLFIMKQHNSFDQNNFSWLNKLKVTSATMILNRIVESDSLKYKKTYLEIVLRNFATFSIGQISQQPFYMISICIGKKTQVSDQNMNSSSLKISSSSMVSG